MQGNKYWKFDPSRSPNVESKYPINMNFWKGIPSNLNGAIQWNRKSYFFKNNLYYRFNDKSFKVDNNRKIKPKFPRPSGSWWFGCPKDTIQFESFKELSESKEALEHK